MLPCAALCCVQNARILNSFDINSFDIYSFGNYLPIEIESLANQTLQIASSPNFLFTFYFLLAVTSSSVRSTRVGTV